MDLIREYFGSNRQPLEPGQVVEMAGQDIQVTRNALRVLKSMGMIEG